MRKDFQQWPHVHTCIVLTASFVVSAAHASEVKEISPITDRVLLIHLVDGRAIRESVDPTSPDATQDGRIEAVPLDTARAAQPASWRISSRDDTRYSAGLQPTKIGRKSKGVQWTRTKDGDRHVMGHWMYLQLPAPLQAGRRYTLDTGTLATGARLRTFRFDPVRLRSETIKVNQVGYVPNGPKFGYLFQYMGDAGALNLDEYSQTRFHIVEDKTGRIVFSGTPTLRQRKGDPNTAPDNNVRGGEDFEGTDVYQCDFSAFNKPGRYRLTSSVWAARFRFPSGPMFIVRRSRPRCAALITNAAARLSRGLIHSGHGPCAITPTSRRSSRCCKPILPATRNITAMALPARKQNRLTGEERNVPGGYHDAADWDREKSHINQANELCLTYELAPKKFHDGELNIPESGNGIPDILDEATWGVDYYRRLQRPDGV
jgi:endoglucanase